ncbi:MAG: PIN domain-containing protein [Phycisphaerales bacterium]
MKYLLDTNTCIAALRNRGPIEVRRRLEVCVPGDLAVCSIVRLELLVGALRSAAPESNTQRVQQFPRGLESIAMDDRIADAAAPVRAVLEANGTPIGPHDLLIAATALVHGLVLVTSDLEFARVPGLTVEDWRVVL